MHKHSQSKHILERKQGKTWINNLLILNPLGPLYPKTTVVGLLINPQPPGIVQQGNDHTTTGPNQSKQLLITIPFAT